MTDDQYLSRGSSIDCSTSEAIRVKLPAKFLIDEMKLTQNYVDGRFFNKDGELVAFDPGVFDGDMLKQVFFKKDRLIDFLKNKGYALLGSVFGQKEVIGGVVTQILDLLELGDMYCIPLVKQEIFCID